MIMVNIINIGLKDKTMRQNLMFSATFSPEIRVIASEFMNDYYYITSNDENAANENIEQSFHWLNSDTEKVLKLHEILQTINGSVISKIELT
jgi:superfamily II DNA/RNA helicase